jgi:DNA-binding GntR family transcriptional regulator
MTAIDHSAPQPASRQLAEILRGQIRSGQLAPGARLPSIVQLSQRYEIAGVTVQKAIRALKTEGWVFTVASFGTFVSASPPI